MSLWFLWWEAHAAASEQLRKRCEIECLRLQVQVRRVTRQPRQQTLTILCLFCCSMHAAVWTHSLAAPIRERLGLHMADAVHTRDGRGLFRAACRNSPVAHSNPGITNSYLLSLSCLCDSSTDTIKHACRKPKETGERACGQWQLVAAMLAHVTSSQASGLQRCNYRFQQVNLWTLRVQGDRGRCSLVDSAGLPAILRAAHSQGRCLGDELEMAAHPAPESPHSEVWDGIKTCLRRLI